MLNHNHHHSQFWDLWFYTFQKDE
uniref:Uncharacterized protein n=1 Tax=Tetranychus urticae TaxID=32264 RepID=T1KY25_TETUR